MTPPPVDWSGQALYGAAWISFGLGHSVLAGNSLKRVLGSGYRLGYNIIAIVSLAAVFAVGRWALGGPGAMSGTQIAAQVAGWSLMVWALKDYDLGLFSGLAQWRAAKAGRPLADDDGPLLIGGLHRFVRHPLYSAAFLILWGGAGSALGTATALWGSLYLLIGTGIEERRLLARHGPAYADYRRRVPAYVPWRGRAYKG